MPRRIDKLREAGTNELEAQQKDLSEQIFRLKFQLSTGQSEALKRLRDAKKDLARVKTLLRAHELKITTGAPDQISLQKGSSQKPVVQKPVQKTVVRKTAAKKTAAQKTGKA
ncbi:MAG TPA: 50S ribosomal protein L29 [Candidatus Dormibacteraeota bacterium]|jgi:large subunit ribosomal protein L29|nr:50S ribosomal protein L29 [Candidatus Dormibacteraeota bacterium]